MWNYIGWQIIWPNWADDHLFYPAGKSHQRPPLNKNQATTTCQEWIIGSKHNWPYPPMAGVRIVSRFWSTLISCSFFSFPGEKTRKTLAKAEHLTGATQGEGLRELELELELEQLGPYLMNKPIPEDETLTKTWQFQNSQCISSRDSNFMWDPPSLWLLTSSHSGPPLQNVLHSPCLS